MPLIFRTVTNFHSPYSKINTNGETSLQCRKIDLYRSIITVGNPSFLTFKNIHDYGLARALYDSIFKKIGIIASNIQSDFTGMRRHPIFESYLSDEKRIISYNLGMAFAKFYSEKILDIPNLIHVEFLKKQNAVTFVKQTGNKRPKEPDLVGQTVDGKWHVFEAKGISTSESHLSGKITEAKKQIQQIATIQGTPPSTGTACATYIGPDRILTYLEDPPSNDGRHVKVNIEKFVESYYAPFLLAEKLTGLTLRKESIDGLDVDFYELQHASRKLRIGLSRELCELIKSKDYKNLNGVIGQLKEYSNIYEKQNNYSIGLDGFVLGYTEY